MIACSSQAKRLNTKGSLNNFPIRSNGLVNNYPTPSISNTTNTWSQFINRSNTFIIYIYIQTTLSLIYTYIRGKGLITQNKIEFDALKPLAEPRAFPPWPGVPWLARRAWRAHPSPCITVVGSSPSQWWISDKSQLVCTGRRRCQPAQANKAVTL